MSKDTFNSYEKFLEIQENYLCMVNRQLEVARLLEMNTEQLDLLNEEISSHNFKVLVMGEFKMGKSTFINALLNTEVLPAFVTPCTAVISEVKWGDEKKAILHLEKDSFDEGEDTREVPIDDIEDFITINDCARREEEVYKNPIKKMELFWPLELCKKGVEIIDSPGLNENVLRERVTSDYFSKADAILFVMSCEKLGPSLSEEQTIKRIKDFGHEDMFFICNRFDNIRPNDRQEIIEYAKDTFKKYISSEANKRIFFISAADALDGRIENDSDLVEESNILQVEAELEKFLTHERGRVKIQRGINLLIENINYSLEEIIPIYLSGLEKKVDDIDSQFIEVKRHLSDIEIERQEVIELISSTRDFIRESALNIANDMFEEIVRLIPKWIEEYDFVEKIELKDVLKLSEKVEIFVDELKAYIEPKIPEVIQKWQKEKISTMVLTEFENTQEKLYEKTNDFVSKIDKIRGEMKGDYKEEIIKDGEKESSINAILQSSPQSIEMAELGISAGSISAASSPLDFGTLLGTVAYTGVGIAINLIFFNLISGTIFFAIGALIGPLVIPVVVGLTGGAGIVSKKIEKVPNVIKEKFEETYINEFRKEIPNLSVQMADSVYKGTEGIENLIENGMRVQVDEIKNQLEKILEEKNKGEDYRNKRTQEIMELKKRLQEDRQNLRIFADQI